MDIFIAFSNIRKYPNFKVLLTFCWHEKLKVPVNGAFKRFAIIQALCRLPYLVVVKFQKAQYLVVFFFLFHRFFGFYRAEVGFLLA